MLSLFVNSEGGLTTAGYCIFYPDGLEVMRLFPLL